MAILENIRNFTNLLQAKADQMITTTRTPTEQTSSNFLKVMRFGC